MLSKILRRTADILYKIEGKISPAPPVSLPAVESPSIQSIRFKPWFESNGDKTLRLNYDLNENSVVFDLGGYEGTWASDIFCKYGCNIHIFEPYHEYAKNIEERFKKNKRVQVHYYGIAKTEGNLQLAVCADSSSVFKNGNDVIDVKMHEATKFFNDNRIDKVDLMKINIEGGEYDLLEHLIEKQMMTRIENIQVQFHDFVVDAETRMRSIQSKLSQTHYITYQYEFVWENWTLIK